MLNILSIVVIVVPSWNDSLNIPWLATQVPWYYITITGLLIWLMTSTVNAARKIHSLQVEIVNVKCSVDPQTETHFGNNIVYLLVTNLEEFDMRDCYANLTRLDYKWANSIEDKRIFERDFRWIDYLTFINLGKHKLPWAAYKYGEEKIIRSGRNNCERINIAKVKDGKLVFLFERKNHSKNTKPGEYKVDVEIGGSANGKQIRRKIFSGDLRYVTEYGDPQLFLHPRKDKRYLTPRRAEWLRHGVRGAISKLTSWAKQRFS